MSPQGPYGETKAHDSILHHFTFFELFERVLGPLQIFVPGCSQKLAPLTEHLQCTVELCKLKLRPEQQNTKGC